MVVCALDKDVPGAVLGWELPTWQTLLLHRVLPSCGGLVVYLTLICFDLALICEHYLNGEDGLATFCVLLMVLPALITLVFTLASPPEGLQTEPEGYSVNLRRSDVWWILRQIVACVFFPIAAIGRYCHQIFWWVEATFAARSEDAARTKGALAEARSPSSMELYLFLQAFVHSAPLVIVNILNFMARFNDPAFHKVSVQAVSIIASTLRMASTATVYRRFEREKLCGRKYPWNFNNGADDTNKRNESAEKKSEEPIYEQIVNRDSVSASRTTERPNANSDLIEFSPTQAESNKSPWFNDDSDIDSGTSSDYMPAAGADARSLRSASDDEYVRPVTLIDRVAPRRRDTQYTIEKVRITPPPAMSAPRPGSLAVWAERMMENAESIPAWLSAPPRYKYVDERVKDEPDVPRHVPSSYSRGLEPQDLTASIIQFLGWYAFFVSRLLSIAAFINCVPVAAIIVLFSHYQVMLLLLIVPQASTLKRGFYIFLAFVYLFCLMEFKIRFRHVRAWHVFWLIVCSAEAVVFSGLWYSLQNDLGDWWRGFVFKVILYGLIQSYMCFMVYFVLLKPRETIVYVKKKSDEPIRK